MKLSRIVQEVVLLSLIVVTGYTIYKETKKLKNSEDYQIRKSERYLNKLRRNGLWRTKYTT